MQRSVIQLAGKTLIVSLPSSWCKHNGIRKGQLLDVTEHGHTLVVGAQAPTRGAIALTLGTTDDIKTTLNACYKRGYDTIDLTLTSAAQLATIQTTITEELLGFEIVRQGKTHCTIKNIAEGLEEEYDALLARCIFLVQTMLDDGDEAIRGRRWEALRALAAQEQTVDKLTNFLKRLLNKRLSHHPDIAFHYSLLRDIEQLSDVLEALYLHLSTTKNIGHEYEPFKEVVLAGKQQLSAIQGSGGRRYPTLAETALERRGDALVRHYLANAASAINNMAGPLCSLTLSRRVPQDSR